MNLAFGSRISLLKLLDHLEYLLGTAIVRCHISARVGDVAHSQADPTRLLALFPGLEPWDLAEGLARTVAWFQAQTGWTVTTPALAWWIVRLDT